MRSITVELPEQEYNLVVRAAESAGFKTLGIPVSALLTDVLRGYSVAPLGQLLADCMDYYIARIREAA
jgi:hypothetical protein